MYSCNSTPPPGNYLTLFQYQNEMPRLWSQGAHGFLTMKSWVHSAKGLYEKRKFFLGAQKQSLDACGTHALLVHFPEWYVCRKNDMYFTEPCRQKSCTPVRVTCYAERVKGQRLSEVCSPAPSGYSWAGGCNYNKLEGIQNSIGISLVISTQASWYI